MTFRVITREANEAVLVFAPELAESTNDAGPDDMRSDSNAYEEFRRIQLMNPSVSPSGENVWESNDPDIGITDPLPIRGGDADLAIESPAAQPALLMVGRAPNAGVTDPAESQEPDVPSDSALLWNPMEVINPMLLQQTPTVNVAAAAIAGALCR
jgi:hypothetical protein